MKELYSNGFASSIAQAIEEMKAEQGDGFSLDCINLAELERRSGVSRWKLRRLKRNGFQDLPRSSKGRKHAAIKLSGYTGIIGSLLRQGIKNSSVILDTSLSAFHAGACPARNDVDFYEFCDESNLTIIHEMIVREH